MQTLNVIGVTDPYGVPFVEENAYHITNACTTDSNTNQKLPFFPYPNSFSSHTEKIQSLQFLSSILTNFLQKYWEIYMKMWQMWQY